MHSPLNVPRTTDTPEVILDAVQGRFEIAFRSYPEDATAFYNPLLEWLSNYSKQPNNETTFHFNLEYFNTSSAKQLFKILVILQELSSRSKVTVNWFYHKEDADMMAAGERFSKLIDKIDFRVISA